MALKKKKHRIAPLLTILGSLVLPAFAQESLSCAWPFKTDGAGLTNVAYPDKNATYYEMPINTSLWTTAVIKGAYPHARFFSYITYTANGQLSALTPGAKNYVYDAEVNPDPGSTNPFVSTPASEQPQTYTITASVGSPQLGVSNPMALSPDLTWIFFRVYVPNAGQTRPGGVPLPPITLISSWGQERTLQPCSQHNTMATSINLDNFGLSEGSSDASPQPNPPSSIIAANSIILFPNPANAYIAIPGLSYEPRRVVVVRGKSAIYPNTYNGGPIWEPANTQLRYWSMCSNKQEFQKPVISCAADHETKLDEDGYYTYVMSEPDPGQKNAPAWLREAEPNATWLNWGLKSGQDLLAFRNMIPDINAPNFPQSVQAATKQGCAFTPGGEKSENEQAECARKIMGPYYPQAVYCDKQILESAGWRGCFIAAGLDPESYSGH